MFAFFTIVCIAAVIGVASSHSLNEIIRDKELVLAFVVNRHGERTPDSDELSLSNEQEKLKNLSYVEGSEGLTNIGKRRAYQIGKFIKLRYGNQGLGLISNLYLQDEIAIRSTDKERTKMTAQVAMAAVYPPEEEQRWDDAVGSVWQPVPYTAVPLEEDYLRYYANCKRFKTLIAKAKEDSLLEEFLPYNDLLSKLKLETGRNFTENPLLFQTLYDLFNSQTALGLDLPEWAKPLMSRLSEAARLAYRLYYKNDEMKKIGGGVLLYQFLVAAGDISSGTPVNKRLRIFSAHDFNIGALIDVARVIKDPTIPEYGSVFALELYRSKSGQFTVQPFYLKQAGESFAQTLSVSGCGPGPCELSKFIELTKDYMLPEAKYYELCGIRTELPVVHNA